MNWMTCRKCRKSFAHILQGKTAAEYHAEQIMRCRYCSDKTGPLMIPATLLKRYEHPVIKAVWDEASRALRQAEEIVVVGYSLPPTDFKARWLFMTASVERRVALRCLIIVDTNPEPLINKFHLAFHAGDDVTRTVIGGIKKASECASRRHTPNY